MGMIKKIMSLLDTEKYIVVSSKAGYEDIQTGPMSRREAEYCMSIASAAGYTRVMKEYTHDRD